MIGWETEWQTQAAVDDCQEAESLVDSAFLISTRVLHARRCSLMLLDEDTKELTIRNAYGLPGEIVAQTRMKLGEGVAGWVAAHRKPLLIRDINEMGSFPGGHRGQGSRYQTSSFVSVPVTLGGSVIGVLNAADKLDGSAFDDEEFQEAQLLANHIALCLEFGALQRRMRLLADTDGLTGLYNHRFFHQRLNEEIERTDRTGRSLSLLMLDFDSFKSYNDNHGHISGDAALREVAAILLSSLRSFDVVSRYGGDEFAIILPETEAPESCDVAQRVERAIARHAFLPLGANKAERLMVSIGISNYPCLAANRWDLIEQADKAMYAAKKGNQPHVRLWMRNDSSLTTIP